jgi:PAS domain S-box-containing protein
MRPDGYLVTDPKGTIQQANAVAASLLGVRRDLVPGKPIVVFIASQAHRAFGAYLARLNDGFPDRVAEWQTTLQPRDNPPFPVTVTAGRIRDRDTSSACAGCCGTAPSGCALMARRQ